MSRSVLFVFLFLFPVMLFSQPYKISEPSASWTFEVDKIGGQVYYYDLSRSAIWKSDIKTGDYQRTDFLDMPEFMRKTHHAIYLDPVAKTICIRDLDSNTTIIMEDSVEALGLDLYLSPNETRLQDGRRIYDFSSGKWIGSIPGEFYCQWRNDSSLILVNSANVLTEYFVESGRMDTLLIKEKYSDITSIAYNYGNNKLYYGYLPPEGPNTQFRCYDPATKTDQLIADAESLNLSTVGGLGFRDMKWSDDNKKLGIIGYHYTVNGSELYLYHLDSNKVFQLISQEEFQYSVGRKDNLEWYNNETILFGWGGGIYGIDVPKSIVAVKENTEKPEGFKLASYPNPFNNSTNIVFKLPEANKGVKLSIFNSIGESVRTIELGDRNGGACQVQWNGKDNYGRDVSSGIYFARLQLSSGSRYGLNTLKLLLLK